MAQESIGLADFVAALRTELRTALATADPSLPIAINAIRVELSISTSREAAGRAGIKFWVADVGIEGGLKKESLQHLTLDLSPLGKAGGPMLINDLEDEPELFDDRRDRQID